MADTMGAALAHIHLGDGVGKGRDEHLVPGRGTQPCAELLSSLAGRGFTGQVAVEVGTRRARSRADREADLAESLAFARQHLGSAIKTTSGK
jgi:sugar phosphate isomerase/epimerase